MTGCVNQQECVIAETDCSSVMMNVIGPDEAVYAREGTCPPSGRAMDSGINEFNSSKAVLASMNNVFSKRQAQMQTDIEKGCTSRKLDAIEGGFAWS